MTLECERWHFGPWTLDLMRSITLECGHWQGFLNSVYAEWYSWGVAHRLSPRFNLQQHVGTAHAAALHHYEREEDGLAVLHFVGGVAGVEAVDCACSASRAPRLRQAARHPGPMFRGRSAEEA